MPFPGNVNKYVLSGSLPGGEVWSTAWYGEATPSPTSAQTLADNFNAAGSFGTSFLSDIRPIMNAGTSINKITVYTYGSGRTLIATGQKSFTPVVGTGTGILPNQIALVVTLRTANNTRRGRGRMYLPATGLTINTTSGLASNTGFGTWLASMGQMLNEYNAKVVSEAAGASYDVSRLTVDNVADTQRGRRDKLVGTATSYTFV